MPPELQPFDEANRRLQANVAPPNWTPPQPQSRYHLVVIGAGTAGLVAAAGAAGLGAKVALIERNLLGGDCLNVGCVPSKALLSAARQVATWKHAETLGGMDARPTPISFSDIMQRVRERRADISPHDSAARFRELGVDVFFGNGTFAAPGRITVGDTQLNYRRALIATGARAAIPPIPGLDQVESLTNETLFSLTELPRRLAILGGGPIGVEMAQAFARLGAEVTLIEQAARLLSREDPEASAVIETALENDGVHLRLNTEVKQVAQQNPGSPIRLTVESATSTTEPTMFDADRLLVATGRAPNVAGLGLETLGIRFDTRQGIHVNDRLQTTDRHVFAAGDVATRQKFTHHADFLARLVLQNALFPGRGKASGLIVPRVTYCSPELAHVGVTPAEAEQAGLAIDTFTQSMNNIDRAIVEERTAGFVKVHVRRGSDRIVGATVVDELAGELIPQFVLAMQHRIGLKQLAATMYPYPTRAEAIRKLGDTYQRTRLTPWIQKAMGMWFRWTG